MTALRIKNTAKQNIVKENKKMFNQLSIFAPFGGNVDGAVKKSGLLR